MEERIDLDVAVVEISDRVHAWRARGLEVDAITWRDQGDGCPATLKTDRRAVRDPDSIGVRMHKGAQEAELVLFKGGWADLLYWTVQAIDEPVVEAPGYDDWLTIEKFGELLDRFGGFFR